MFDRSYEAGALLDRIAVIVAGAGIHRRNQWQIGHTGKCASRWQYHLHRHLREVAARNDDDVRGATSTKVWVSLGQARADE